MLQRFTKLTEKQKTGLALLAFAVLVLVFYGNTLGNGFVYDDNPQIVENPYVQSWRYLPKVVSGCAWESVLGTCEGAFHYRPIQNLSLLLTYQISSAPWIFHLINVVYFFILVALIFFFIKMLTHNTLLAFFTAFIFLIHPIHAEVVNWIVALVELTAGIFVLATLITYMHYRRTNMQKYFVAALLFYFFAMLSKEGTALTLPPILVALDFFIFGKRRELFGVKQLKQYAWFGLPFLMYFVMRQLVVGSFGTIAISERYFGGATPHDRIYYFFWLFVTYLKNFFYPSFAEFWLHDVPRSPSFFNAEFFIIFSLFVVFFAALFLFFRKGKSTVAFGFAWFAVFIAPVLVFYFAAGGAFYAKRYMMTPTIGLSFVAASLLMFLWQFDGGSSGRKRRKKKVTLIKGLAVKLPQEATRGFVIVALLVVAGLSWNTVYSHNQLWINSVTLSEAELSVNPNTPQPRQYLAGILRWQGDIEGARFQYMEILRRNPDYHRIGEVYLQLAQTYRQEGNIEKAEHFYLQALEQYPGGDANVFNDLGILYIEHERYPAALLYFCRAVRTDPVLQGPQVNFERAIVQFQSIQEDDAATIYREVTTGEVFRKGEDEPIRYLQRECSGERCRFFFSAPITIAENMLPFFIHGFTSRDALVTIKASSYNPEGEGIMLEIDTAYKNADLDFIFPTCEGLYYSVSAEAE